MAPVAPTIARFGLAKRALTHALQTRSGIVGETASQEPVAPILIAPETHFLEHVNLILIATVGDAIPTRLAPALAASIDSGCQLMIFSDAKL
jgi:hypothetical protein